MSDSDTLKEAFSHLEQLQVSYMATIEDKQPRVRAMMLIYHEGKFYYATDSSDEKVTQVTLNPKVEICVLLGEGDDSGSLRITGLAEFVYNEDTRSGIHGCIGFIQSFWENPQNPAFILWKIKPQEIRYMRPGTMEIKKQVL